MKTVTEMLLKRDENHVINLSLKVAEYLVHTKTFIRLNYLNKKILELKYLMNYYLIYE